MKMKTIDEALEFYDIDKKYKKVCYQCVEDINKNFDASKLLEKIVIKLFKDDFTTIKKLWKFENINDLLGENINSFITNLIILLGYNFHRINMNELKFDNEQISIHKKRVKECFESDLKNRTYKAIRLSQMLWAIYFIRGRIIEIGNLQFEYDSDDIIKIHIPKNTDFDISKSKESIKQSKEIIKNTFRINDFKYVCNSWLLSNQIYEMIDKNTNISKFHDLFKVKDGEDCEKDILNFVYRLDKCDDYSLLETDTTLQLQIKNYLKSGKKIYLGLGVLK